MKKLYISLFTIVTSFTLAYAQPTVATDFTMNDCNGKMHNLFSELDSGNVVIMEFFMTSCQSCIDAGKDMKPMHQSLVNQYGNKVRFFQTGFNNTYSCATVLNWINTNNFISVPFDSGAYQVAYYGGMGMPTIAIAAGNTHKLLFLNVGFNTSDTTIMGIEIRNFLDSVYAGVNNINTVVESSVFPNPASEQISISLNSKESGILKLELLNSIGALVSDLTVENIYAGYWKKTFTLPPTSGVYFVRGSINNKSFYKKFSLIKN